jgi:hypothetical protein
LRNVHDHPLAFLNCADAQQIRRTASRRQFPVLDPIPQQSKLIGVFGFLGRYKGFDTVVRALHHLPKDYHLLIFGGVHPNEIKLHQPIDPVVSSLFEAGYVDTSVAEQIRVQAGASAPAVSVAFDGSMRDLLIEHPKDLSDRIHFLGPQSDADFLSGMAICDAVVFPYLEVGQSSSGPISQALELGCRILASRTHTSNSPAITRTSSSSSTSAITSNWPGICAPARNTSPAFACRHSMSTLTARSTSPPMAARPFMSAPKRDAPASFGTSRSTPLSCSAGAPSARLS